MLEVTYETGHTHPLLQKELRRLDWRGWKKAWEETNDPDLLMGLLHTAFDCSTGPGEWAERVIFLLAVADGHSHLESFDQGTCGAKQHQRVAEKAFKVLCGRWFKAPDEKYYHEDSPLKRVLVDGIYQKVLWFFDDRERRGPHFFRFDANLPQEEEKEGHHRKIARKFVQELIEETWSLHFDSDEHGLYGEELEEWKAVCFAARPAYIRMLWQIGDLNFLTRRRLDDASMEELHRLALQGYHKTYQTVEAAVYAGHHPAKIYLIADANRKEGDRQDRIKAAEVKKREAERELELAQES